MLWLVILVCLSILDTAILVPWMLTRKKTKQETTRQSMKILTPRLTICPFSPDMAQAVYENSREEAVRRFTPDEVFDSPEEALDTITELIRCYADPTAPKVYPVLLTQSGENIGYVQLVPFEEGSWEIGYHIAERHAGKGYAAEAVNAFLPVMMEKLSLQQVYGISLAENIASLRVLEKCGFRILYRGQGSYQGETREIVRSLRKREDGTISFLSRFAES